MERRGLVLRTDCDTDARGTWIGLTPDGRRAVLGAMRDHARALRQYFFDLLDDADRASLLSISGRVLEAIEPTACEVSGLDDEALG
jgi:DNA-binding MarR family transcriptional regulator